MKAMPIAPMRPIAGTGGLTAVSNGADTAVTTIQKGYAVQLSVSGANCMVRISPNGQAATATADILLKVSDPPRIYACQPGDEVHAFGLAASCELNHIEMTH